MRFDFVCIYHADARSSVCLLNKFGFNYLFVLLYNKNSNTTYIYRGSQCLQSVTFIIASKKQTEKKKEGEKTRHLH